MKSNIFRWLQSSPDFFEPLSLRGCVRNRVLFPPKSWPDTRVAPHVPPGRAMLEMDQILRSNEINFAVLAALPAVLVSIAIFALARQYALYQVPMWSVAEIPTDT